MTYDILLEGRNGERLVDFAASDAIKDRKVMSYVNTFNGCSREYGINNVVVRSRETNEVVENHNMSEVA